ncbi:MAG: propionate catabolism operon regulatory protein PrpR [Janthinobacterium lividum]
MERAPGTLPTRPRIWAVGISKLGELYRDIAAAYDPIADLTLVTRGFEEALHDLEGAGIDRPDVIVAAGSNGSYLKARIDIPVVLVTPTGFDVMHALARARREGSRLALVMHGETPAEVLRFCTVFGIDVQHASYLSAEDAEGCVLDLRDRGVDAIVGPGLVTELAERAGVKSVFLYSRASVQAAFDTALEVARATLGETARRRRLDQVMQNLRDGVLALNAQGGVEAMSGKMAEMLRRTPSQVIGRQLAALAPEIAAVVPALPGESLESVRGVTYLVHRSAWGEPGQGPAGALVTFHESTAMQRMDRSVRVHQRGQRGPLPHARYHLSDMIGECAAVAALRQRVLRYAGTDATVLIRGESGTGKELVAQGIHNASARRDGAFVALNCGAFPETLLESELFGYEEGAFTGARRGGKPGLFETAHHGTVFLDEIGEMPRPLQSRLLRVLQEREVVRLGSGEPIPVDVRVIAATHQPLLERIEAGEFRADLYYRLNILNVVLPPLRERAADMALLAAHLLLQTGCVTSLDAARQVLAEVLPILAAYRWPGNVRELQNVIERIAVEFAPGGERAAETASEAAAGAMVTPEWLADIAPELFADDRQASSLKARARRIEVDEIRAALAACDGDRDKACAVLGISKTTLWRRLSQDPLLL